MRWSATHPVFASAERLSDVLELGHCPAGAEVRRALAALAPTDEFAARTLLQALLGGPTNLARRIGRDADAIDEMVSLAWERIRTYPAHRPGSVSGNVWLDVRKRYLRIHDTETRCAIATPRVALEPSAADHVVRNAFVRELVATGEQRGLSGIVLETIIRSRVGGESITDLAAEQHISVKVLLHRRWRAEARLREFPLAG